MDLDIKKCFNAALLPAAVIVVIAVIVDLVLNTYYLVYLTTYSTPAYILGLQLLVSLAILAWAGYRVVKEQSMDLVGGVVTGTIAGGFALFIDGMLHLALISLGIVFVYISTSAQTTGLAAIDNVEIFGFILSVVIGTIVGAVGGAIGAFIAGMKK